MRYREKKITRVGLILTISIVFLLMVFGFADGSTSFYGMEIESVTPRSGKTNQVTIITTGAEYVLTRTGMEMWRRIDPATNTINKRRVAELTFPDMGEFEVISENKLEVNITSLLANFSFNSDSFFFIKAKGSFSYTHKNLILNALWSKPEQEYLWSGLDRMWTDGYGGSLHAFIKGNPRATTSADSTNISMKSGDVMGEMVYPPKRFDFERLYGAGARPFVFFQIGTNYVGTPNHLDNLSSNLDKLSDGGFGVIVLWNDFYEKAPGYTREQYFPYLLDSGVYGYEFNYPQETKDFITKAHNKGFKVITYMQAGQFNPSQINGQDVETTLQWMRDFQRNYNLDGFYFDGAGIYGSGSKNLEGNYNFIKQARENIDIIAKEHGVDNGIIYHHDSLDVWDDYAKYRGLRAIMIDAYVDYTLTGETDYTVNSNEYKGMSAQVDSPNDIYLRFYTSGYGLSQAYAAYVRITNNRAAISKEEYARAMGEDLNGLERIYYIGNLDNPWWKNYFKPAYEKRKLAYLSHPDVSWPINNEMGWFRTPSNINVEYVTDASVNIKWETSGLSDSNVSYTNNGVWWLPDGSDGSTGNKSLVTKHSITLNGLDTNKNYEFKIRSSNNLTKTNEIIWGYIGNFKISDLDKSFNVYGDVSGDGKVSAYDAALIAQKVAGLITLTPEQTKAADISGDGKISAYDAALITQMTVGL